MESVSSGPKPGQPLDPGKTQDRVVTEEKRTPTATEQ
jgi:hypothetical protein